MNFPEIINLQKTFAQIQEEVTAPIRRVQEAIKQAMKPFEALQKVLKHYVYVDPTTFESLLEIYIPVNDIPEKNEKEYYIFTNRVKAPKYKDTFIIVNKETAFLISKLDMTYRHRYYLPISKAPYNKKKGELTIEGTTIKFMKDHSTHSIINSLFGSVQYIKKVRNWDYITKNILDLARGEEQHGIIKNKVSRINIRISKKFGYENMIIFENKTLFVNPDYYFLFKS